MILRQWDMSVLFRELRARKDTSFFLLGSNSHLLYSSVTHPKLNVIFLNIKFVTMDRTRPSLSLEPYAMIQPRVLLTSLHVTICH